MKNMHLLYAHDHTWTWRVEDLAPQLHEAGGGAAAEVRDQEVPVYCAPSGAVVPKRLGELRGCDAQGRCRPDCDARACPQLHANPTPYGRHFGSRCVAANAAEACPGMPQFPHFLSTSSTSSWSWRDCCWSPHPSQQ